MKKSLIIGVLCALVIGGKAHAEGTIQGNISAMGSSSDNLGFVWDKVFFVPPRYTSHCTGFGPDQWLLVDETDDISAEEAEIMKQMLTQAFIHGWKINAQVDDKCRATMVRVSYR